MKQKNKMSEAEGVLGEEQESTDFTIINDEVYSENEIPFELDNDLPEVIDEDMLYDEYRDRELFDTKTGQPKQRHKW